MLTPSEQHVELLKFADRVRKANNLSHRDFWTAMSYAEQIEALLKEESGHVESAALAVAVYRCGQRAQVRAMERRGTN